MDGGHFLLKKKPCESWFLSLDSMLIALNIKCVCLNLFVEINTYFNKNK